MPFLQDLIDVLEAHAPVGLQEGFDNSGLLLGNPSMELRGVVVCLDLTEEVLQEAIDLDVNCIISHHPLIFKGLKNLQEKSATNRILVRAIKNDIALYAAHTNLDKTQPGVSTALADQLNLTDQSVLVPDSGSLEKIITFVPMAYLDEVRQALTKAGAGRIGNYDSCSFHSVGKGQFRAMDGAQPHVGHKGELHTEEEAKLEMVYPAILQGGIVAALIQSHPYEEVAYDLMALLNTNPHIGLGVVGNLKEELSSTDFLAFVKQKLGLEMIRHTNFNGKVIKRVAVCGGSGSEFLSFAKSSGADAYISGDFKYHQFFEGEGKIMIADIGHFESEVFALPLLKEIVTKKIANFAVHLSKIVTNPIKYY